MEKYTEEEMELIKSSMKITRKEFDKDLDPEVDEDILKGILLHKNKYHMNQEDNKLATEIFRKNGLWKNGKITIEDHDHQLLQEKLKQIVKYKDIRQNQVIRLKEIQKAIDMKIEEIEQKPIEIAKKMGNRKKEFQEKAYGQLNNLIITLEEQMIQTANSITEQFNNRKNVVLNELKSQINDLKRIERLEIDKVIREYEELEKLKQEYVEINQVFDSKAEVVEEQMKETDAKLLGLTVSELKEMADKKGLSYAPRILKADLIEMIQGE